MSQRLVVAAICPSRVFRADGERLREAILGLWNDEKPIEIDFEEQRVASASFLDESIGVLALEYPLEVLKSCLKPIRMTNPDRALLNQILARRAQERLAGDGTEKRPSKVSSP